MKDYVHSHKKKQNIYTHISYKDKNVLANSTRFYILIIKKRKYHPHRGPNDDVITSLKNHRYLSNTHPSTVKEPGPFEPVFPVSSNTVNVETEVAPYVQR